MKKNLKYKILEGISPIAAMFLAAALSSIIILAIKKNPVEVYVTMFTFSFRRMDSIAVILFNATPLIFSGLAVALSFRVGLFNIGVEGQYLIGAFMAALVGFAVKGLPWFIHFPMVVLAAACGGGLWALLPIVLKIKRGVHEVITTIMMNYISFSLIHFFIADIFMDKQQKMLMGLGSPIIRMPKIQPSALIPGMHSFLSIFGINLPKHVYLNWFFPLAILLAFGIFYLLWFTPFGYELRVVGHNRTAAKASGINPQKVYIKGFLLSGAIAGLIGLSDLLGYFGYMDLDFPKGYGFTGIAVALIGKNNPLGVIPAALLFGFLNRGAEGIQTFIGVPMDTVVILQGLMILSIVIISEVMVRYIRNLEKKEARLS